MIRFSCPHCQIVSRCRESLAGANVPCRHCGGYLIVPTLDETASQDDEGDDSLPEPEPRKTVSPGVTAAVLALVVGVFVLGVVVTLAGRSGKRTESAEKRWYEGGTLHGATMREWRLAAYSNRLATAADMVTASLQLDGVSFDPESPEFRRLVETFVAEMNAANSDGRADGKPVSEVGSLVYVLMKSRKR